MSAKKKARKTAAWIDPKRIARSVVLVTAVGAVVGGGHLFWTWIQRPDVMPLTRVAIDGELEHLRRDQLEAVVAMAVWGNYFTVDIDAVRRAADSLPWVGGAAVRRVWPDTLVIRVQERTPFARWGREALVNARGEVFRPSTLDGISDLPRLAGPDEQGLAVVKKYRELAPVFESLGWKVHELRLDDRGGWWLSFADGLEIVLGREALDVRLERALRILRLLGPDAARLARVDARYTSGLAVRWKPESEDDDVATSEPVRG